MRPTYLIGQPGGHHLAVFMEALGMVHALVERVPHTLLHSAHEVKRSGKQ